MKQRPAKSLLAIAACWITIVSLCPIAYGRSGIGCGEEFRIETVNGRVFEGKLDMNSGGLLILSGSGEYGQQRIPMNDVKTVMCIQHNRSDGMVLGFLVGAGLGVALSSAVLDFECKDDDQMFECMNRQIGNGIGAVFLTVFCAGVGMAIGGELGHADKVLTEVPIDKLPICVTPSNGSVALNLKFAVNL